MYGRKRADWAASARGEFRTLVKKDMLPPLLLAAQIGNLESVEWFLSDTPTRCYSEFAEANSDSLPVKTLAQATGGFDAAVSKFLNSKSTYISLTPLDNIRRLDSGSGIIFQITRDVVEQSVALPEECSWDN